MISSSPVQTPRSSRIEFCSAVSREGGEDPAGSAWATSRYLLLELPLPWAYNLLESKRTPDGLPALLADFRTGGVECGFIGIAPDPVWSQPGMTRVIEFCQPATHRGPYRRREYLFPEDQAIALTRRAVETPDDPALRPYRQHPDPDTWDILVCTHGAVDACCATFGYPTYQLLHHMASGADKPLRVWRCTHFGGHRFASTVLELPSGRYWGRLEARDLAPLIRRNRPAAQMRHLYRGWSAVASHAAQIAEADLFAWLGWRWLDFAVSWQEHEARDGAGTIVEFTFTSPEGACGHATIAVEPAGTAMTKHSTKDDTLVEVPQYTTRFVALETGSCGTMHGSNGAGERARLEPGVRTGDAGQR